MVDQGSFRSPGSVRWDASSGSESESRSMRRSASVWFTDAVWRGRDDQLNMLTCARLTSQTHPVLLEAKKTRCYILQACFRTIKMFYIHWIFSILIIINGDWWGVVWSGQVLCISQTHTHTLSETLTGVFSSLSCESVCSGCFLLSLVNRAVWSNSSVEERK